MVVRHGATRTKRGNLQVRTDYLTHPGTNRNVKIIGMVHVADADFYKAIDLLIDGHVQEYGLEDFGVVCEGTKPAEGTDFRMSPAWASEPTLRMMGQGGMYAGSASLAGLVAQGTEGHCKRRDWWQVTDVPMHEVLEMLGEQDAKAFTGMLDRGNAAATTLNENDEQVKIWIGRILKFTLRHLPLLSKIQRGLSGKIKRVVLDHRSVVGAQGIHACQKREIVSLWGAGHVDQIRDELVALGWEYQTSFWRTAVRK